MKKLITPLVCAVLVFTGYYYSWDLEAIELYRKITGTEKQITRQFYTVDRVVDGDTIVVTAPDGISEKVRMIGIDTPESKANEKAKKDAKRSGKDLETMINMGHEATEFVEQFFDPGRSKILLEFDVVKRDKYNRLLAYVFLKIHSPHHSLEELSRVNTIELKDGVPYALLNAQLVTNGYATPMTIPPNVDYSDLFQELYEEAREQKRGLWKYE